MVLLLYFYPVYPAGSFLSSLNTGMMLYCCICGYLQAKMILGFFICLIGSLCFLLGHAEEDSMPSITYTCDFEKEKVVEQTRKPQQEKPPAPTTSAAAPKNNFFQTLDWSNAGQSTPAENIQAPSNIPNSNSDANLLGLSPPQTPNSQIPSAAQLTPPTERKVMQQGGGNDFDLLGLSSAQSHTTPTVKPTDQPPSNFDILSGSSQYDSKPTGSSAKSSDQDLMGGMSGSSDMTFDPFGNFSSTASEMVEKNPPAVASVQSEFMSFDPFGSSNATSAAQANGYNGSSNSGANSGMGQTKMNGASQQSRSTMPNQRNANVRPMTQPASKTDPFAGKLSSHWITCICLKISWQNHLNSLPRKSF